MPCSDIKSIVTDKAPKPIGPYSQAKVVNGYVFTSGQIGIDPKTGDLLDSNVKTQTRRVLENLQTLLEAAGSDLNHVVKTTVFLLSMDDFQEMNAVYAEYFNQTKPARSTVAVKSLPAGARVEIDAIAVEKK